MLITIRISNYKCFLARFSSMDLFCKKREKHRFKSKLNDKKDWAG